MSTSSDRRRRILNDGTRTTGAGETGAAPAAEVETAIVSRYAENQESTSFAIARRVLPHRRRAIAGVVAAGLLGTAGLLAGHHYQAEIAMAVGVSEIPAINLLDTSSLANWATTVAMATFAALCLLVYGLRRHRADDLRGLYRWWLSASLAAMACSACASTGLHTSLAEVAATKSGWLPLGYAALWWIVPTALMLGTITLRVLLDLKHCVPALLASFTAMAFCGTAIMTKLGYTPTAVAPWSTLVVHGAVLLSLLTAITALLCYSRRIVLEANGEINAPVQRPMPKVEKIKAEKSTAESKAEKKIAAESTPAAEKPVSKPRVAPATTPKRSKPTSIEAKSERPKSTASETQWTDGSDGHDEYDEDGQRRKLSKAERKRLRKLKARQGRAA